MAEHQYDLRGRDFIVVGGAGYIGMNVCKRIAECGGPPIVLFFIVLRHIWRGL